MKVPTLPSCDLGERRGRGSKANGDSSDTHDLEVNLMNLTPFLVSLLQIVGTAVEGKNEVRDRLRWRELFMWR